MLSSVLLAAALLGGLAAAASNAQAGDTAASMNASPAVSRVPPGPGRLDMQAGGLALTVFTYRPAAAPPLPGYLAANRPVRGPVLVVLHDEGGDARRYRDLAIPIAEAHGYTIAAPQLDAERFSAWRYPWAGVARRTFPDNGVVIEPEPPALRLDAVLSSLIGQLRSDGGAPVPHALLGHGAGAEALMRWSAFAPTEAMHIVAANPRTTLMPNRSLDFPWGFGQLPGSMASEPAIRAYLAQPLTLVLGSSRADRAVGGPAGDSLLARGRNLLSAGRQAALESGRPVYWRLVEVADAGDDAGRLFSSPAVLQALLPFVGDE
ncbi:MAG: hypothetical protein ING90_19165 [Rhodocyclaceae bacterium]|nr:hypothetical protein [Rhodocyclaceae bacterium]MCE2978405.1 hypothetical protein [Betaproteobacteria bacterium]